MTVQRRTLSPLPRQTRRTPLSPILFAALIALAAGSSFADKGVDAYNRGDFAEAIARYSEQKSGDSLTAQHRYNLGTSLLAAGRFGEAAAELQQALPLADSSLAASAGYNLGNALYRTGEAAQGQERIEAWRKSIDAWRRTLQLRPDHEKAKRNIELVQKRIEEELDKQKQDPKDQEKQDQNKDQDQQQQQDQQQDQNRDQNQDQQQQDQKQDPNRDQEQQEKSDNSQDQQQDQNMQDQGGTSSSSGDNGSSQQQQDQKQGDDQPQNLSSDSDGNGGGSSSSRTAELTPEEAKALLESYGEPDKKGKGRPVRGRRGPEKDW